MLLGGGRLAALSRGGFALVTLLLGCSPACQENWVELELDPDVRERVSSVSVQGACTIRASCDADVCESYLVIGTGPGKCLARVEYSDGAPGYATTLRFDGCGVVSPEPGDTIEVP
jgi:hypothetical protein